MRDNKTTKTNIKDEEVRYSNGVSIYTMKKIAIYEFGEGGFIQIKKDNKNWTFHIIVEDQIEDWQIAKFKDYWKVRISKLSEK